MGESSTSDSSVRVAAVVPETEAEGPGRRFALWVQGCGIRCDGCFNPQMWTTVGGRDALVAELLADIERADVEGITLLGGEPFEQAPALALLASEVQRRGLTVMTFTGHEYDHLVGPEAPDGSSRFLASTDLLISGPYVAGLPDLARPWVGSTNQRFHFLTERYARLEAELDQLPDRIEVRIASDGHISVNGWASVAQIDDLLAGVGSPLGRGRVR